MLGFFSNNDSAIPWFKACSVKDLGVEVARGFIRNIFFLKWKVSYYTSIGTEGIWFQRYSNVVYVGYNSLKVVQIFAIYFIFQFSASRLLDPISILGYFNSWTKFDKFLPWENLFQFPDQIDLFTEQCISDISGVFVRHLI